MEKEVQNSKVWDVVVVGGGSAGMMAAGRAAERGRSVLLLEKNPTLGKKLLITGGGRCNITNNQPVVRGMLANYKASSKFLFSAFTQFGVRETLEFFEKRGLAIKEEDEGRMFPVSNKAKSVWDVLVHYMKREGVTVQTNSQITGISYNEHLKLIVLKFSDMFTVQAKACVIATGGVSHQETGSTGEGFVWLGKFGHTVIKNDLSLVPIVLKNTWVKKLAGVTLKNIKLTKYKNNTWQKEYKGKLLFTHVGISGPTVLNMSREVSELLSGKEGSEYARVKTSTEVTIMLDLFPTLDTSDVRAKLQAMLVEQSNKKIKNVLSSLISPTLVDIVLMQAGIDSKTPNHSVRSEERKALVLVLKSIPLSVKGLLGKDKAVISSGGVALQEVNFKTMQSRILPQLYLVGDVLNIDRPSGGYSLQLCWTSGYIAGSNC